MRLSLFSAGLFILFSKSIYSQGCCSGGSGSPIAGGTSQGVLSERQMELNANYQYLSTSKFYTGDKPDTNLFSNLNSNYLYFRVAYGVSKNLTMSVESGYFINKTQNGLPGKDSSSSKGIGDLLLFPRYTIYSKNEETKKTEITLGLGFKIPLGKYNDSMVVYTDPTTGQKLYTTSPPSVQPTNGSHDFIFYGFVYRGYPEKNFRIFMNALYVKKGWNPLGEKFGDYASVGLFAGQTFFKKLGVTVQVKGEWLGKMQAAKNIDLLAFYGVDTASTGGRKVLIVPQISYSYKKFTVYVLSEFPLYQYVNKSQVASQYQITAGLTYRFMIKKKAVKEEKTPS